MNALASGPAVSSPDVLQSPRYASRSPEEDESSDDLFEKLVRRVLARFGLEGKKAQLEVEAAELNLEEVYELSVGSVVISHVEYITEEPLQHTDAREFLEHTPPLEAEGRVTFSVREKEPPELDWNI